MSLSLFQPRGFLANRSGARRGGGGSAVGFARATTIAVLTLVMAGGPAAHTALAAKKVRPLPDTMLPLRITDVVVRDGELIARGTLGDTRFESPVTLTSSPNPADPTCPILDIALDLRDH